MIGLSHMKMWKSVERLIIKQCFFFSWSLKLYPISVWYLRITHIYRKWLLQCFHISLLYTVSFHKTCVCNLIKLIEASLKKEKNEIIATFILNYLCQRYLMNKNTLFQCGLLWASSYKRFISKGTFIVNM